MSSFQRIKSIILAVLMILYALVMLLIPEEAYDIITAIVSISLLVYGIKLMFYYFSMARHMVGGKIVLYEAVIILDLALFTFTMISMSSFTLIIYLLGIYSFTGVIDILRAIEAKKNGAKSWRLKLLTGVISVVFVMIMAVLGLVFMNTNILVYSYSISLTYTAVIKIITACRKTAIVYIQ